MTSSDTARKRLHALAAGAQLELLFSDLLANGQGVGRAEGIVVFCFGPLPGERARVRIKEVKQRYAVADLIEVLSVSRERTQPFCPVFGLCGGCQLQHLSYAGQLAWKHDLVRNALQRIGGLHGALVSTPIGMNEPRAYRNKMALVIEDRDSRATLGFYRQRSHEIVAIDSCPIVRPVLDATLRRLDAIRKLAPIARVLRDVRHLVARSSNATGQIVLSLTTDRPRESLREAAPLLMREIPQAAGVANSFDRASANAILGRELRVLAGNSQVEEEIGGLRYSVSAGSFFQINPEIVGRIFEFLEPYATPPAQVVDLYCGVGTFTLYFARRGWRVVGVEENPQAVAEAAANARRNSLQAQVHFRTGRVEEVVGEAPMRATLREAATVFLDPPRKGCDQATLSALAAARVPVLWYLSCDAATLARDLKFLVAKGYRLVIVQPFDMFPQTGHIETLVRLERA